MFDSITYHTMEYMEGFQTFWYHIENNGHPPGTNICPYDNGLSRRDWLKGYDDAEEDWLDD